MSFSAARRSTLTPCSAAIWLSVCPGCTTTTRSFAAAGGMMIEPVTMAVTSAPTTTRGCGRIDIAPPDLRSACMRRDEPSAHDGRPMLGALPDRSRYERVGMGYFGTVEAGPAEEGRS